MSVVLWTEEVVSEGADVRQTVQDHVHVVIGLDVVQTHNSWNEVWGTEYGKGD